VSRGKVVETMVKDVQGEGERLRKGERDLIQRYYRHRSFDLILLGLQKYSSRALCVTCCGMRKGK
jgi:hypothetical protein